MEHLSEDQTPLEAIGRREASLDLQVGYLRYRRVVDARQTQEIIDKQGIIRSEGIEGQNYTTYTHGPEETTGTQEPPINEQPETRATKGF
jgi:hypothetical protein